MATGIVVLSLAMGADPAFGKRIEWASRLLGAGVVVLIDPASLVAALGVFALIGFHFALGWKVHRLSKVA